MKQSTPTPLGDIIKHRRAAPPPPAYPWQDLALRIIRELSVPNFKRNAVFKVCRDLPLETVKRALDDTKELCQSGRQWAYFFKIVAESAPRRPGSGGSEN